MNYLTDLSVVGTGIAGPGHVSVEAQLAIRRADRVLALVADPLTRHWLWGFRPDAEDLSSGYAVGRPRMETYIEMVDRILKPVRQDLRVCAVFYGHPGVFVYPSHEAIRRAKQEGYTARMLPAISAEDCLFADLGVDPGQRGCQSYEATVFLAYRRAFDPKAGLVLWQAGAVGVEDVRKEDLWNQDGLRLLADVLLESYPPTHPVVVYEASTLPVGGSKIVRTALGDLPGAPVTALSTLWIEPLSEGDPDPEMLQRLGLAK
jgi:hypothetical protein